MRKLGILLCFFLVPAVLFAQQQGETIKISSYYPSPYGVYKTLRFYPNDNYSPGTSCANAGEMYYDKSENRLYICSGSPLTWIPFGSGGISYEPNLTAPGYSSYEAENNINNFTVIPVDGVPIGARFAILYITIEENREAYFVFADMSGNIFGKVGDGANADHAETTEVNLHRHSYDPSSYSHHPAAFAIVPVAKDPVTGKMAFKMNLGCVPNPSKGKYCSGKGTVHVYRLGYIE